MTEEQNKEYEIDVKQYLDEDEQKGLAELQNDFIESYIVEKNTSDLPVWLNTKLGKELPDKSPEEIKQISDEIIGSLQKTEEMKVSLEQAIEIGRSQESWLEGQLKNATAQMSTQESAKYLQGLDDAIKKANAEMLDTVTTQAGAINQNMNLDGFIAEQHHANSFNMSAQTTGDTLRAEVLKPKLGEVYGKNTVDIVVKDASGKIVSRYQVKYGATAQDTIRMIKEGDYRGQQLIVPEEQVKEVQKAFPDRKVSSEINAGKSKGKPLTKEQAKEMRDKVQKGDFMELDWNDYSIKDVAKGVAKQAGLAAVQGAAISTGIMLASNFIQGKKIKGEEVVETAIKTGADIGVKTATAGALKVAVEKGIVRRIPKGIPGATYANIAFVAIENVKIMSKFASGELTAKECLTKMERTTGACIGGIVASTKGAAWGASIGAALGPVGAAVGGIIGGSVAYVAGSKVGETVIKAAQKVRSVAVDTVKSAAKAVYSGVKAVGNAVCSAVSSVADWLF